jgi:hypothetical protein
MNGPPALLDRLQRGRRARAPLRRDIITQRRRGGQGGCPGVRGQGSGRNRGGTEPQRRRADWPGGRWRRLVIPSASEESLRTWTMSGVAGGRGTGRRGMACHARPRWQSGQARPEDAEPPSPGPTTALPPHACVVGGGHGRRLDITPRNLRAQKHSDKLRTNASRRGTEDPPSCARRYPDFQQATRPIQVR